MNDLINNRFKLLKKCGAGGTGEVYQAEDLRLKRLVALKCVRVDSRSDQREKALRLLKEAEHMALVDHPNVVAVHDVIEREDTVAIVMELVRGIPFKELFRREPIAEPELLVYLQQLTSALEAVHAAGIVHRDLNPKNVMVTPDGTIKVTDFGLSVFVDEPKPRAGGTIGYMAPEALRKGSRASFGVDIYSLGLMCYQSLLGASAFRRLYGAEKAIAWARWLLSRERFKSLVELQAGVSPGLSVVIEKMLEKDPKDRYARVADVVKDLARREPAALRPASGPSLVAGMRRLLPTLLARPKDWDDA
jgi:serine/threonine protein kinase